MKIKIPLNIPNVLTFIRFLLVPVAIYYAVKDKLLTGFIIYTIACATDVLDGVIARKFNMITEAGKLLDPLADKVMIMGMVVTFTVLGVLPIFVLIIVVVKEVTMISGGIFLYKNNIVVQANIFGKIAALLLHLSIGFTFLHNIYGKVYLYLMYLALAMSLASLVQYFYLNMYKKYVKPKRESDELENND